MSWFMIFEVSVKHISLARYQMLWIGFARPAPGGPELLGSLRLGPAYKGKGRDLSYETYLKSSSAHAYALNSINYYTKN